MAEVYVSVDIEADGPIPGDNSMLSIGAVAFDVEGLELGYFSENLELLPEATPDPGTTAFWDDNPEAYAATREDTQDPSSTMHRLERWLHELEGPPVFVGYPVSFDQMFVHWYMMHFVKRDPFGFSGIDLKTYAMVILGTPFKKTIKKRMPKDWFKDLPKHTHIALDDAREQGILFFRMRDHHSLVKSQGFLK